MSGLLASLHYIVGGTCIGSMHFLRLYWRAVTTTRLYKYFYKETPEEESGNILAICWCNHETLKEVRAYVLLIIYWEDIKNYRKIFSSKEKNDAAWEAVCPC